LSPRSPVFVITGQSGAGKGTLIRELFQRMPDCELAVSATTRPKRPGEIEGVDYWFISNQDFDERLGAGEFLEYHVFPWGQRSGTLRSELSRIAGRGRICVLELETEGALAVKEVVPEAVTIFITAPIDVLERRLQERATESAGEIDERIALARDQWEQRDRFDHVIANDDLERAVDTLETIVRRELEAAGTIPQP
jgi:guanylate kinase